MDTKANYKRYPHPLIGHHQFPTLLRWFSYNSRRDTLMAAIALQRTRAKDTEGQVLDFLVRHCGGDPRGT